MSKNEIFSKEPINTSRQPEVDLAKAMIIFFLPFIHCSIECTSDEGLTHGLPYIFDTVIGGPLASPMFMFSMGLGMVYSRNNNAAAFARRGLFLFIEGFLFNFARFSIPFCAGYFITGDYEHYIAPISYRTMTNDILQFAGLAFMLIALLKKLKVPDLAMLLPGVAMSGAAMFLNGVDVGTPEGNIALGYLIGTEDAAEMVFSDFPLMNWFIVPVSGVMFGKLLKRVKDKKKFYLRVSPPCLAIVTAYFAIGINNEFGMFGEGQNCFYHISLNDVLIGVLAVPALLGVYYFITNILPKKALEVIFDISRNITTVYCVHWVVISWVVIVWIYAARGTQELPVAMTMLLSFAISIASITTAHFWENKKRKKFAERKASSGKGGQK